MYTLPPAAIGDDEEEEDGDDGDGEEESVEEGEDAEDETPLNAPSDGVSCSSCARSALTRPLVESERAKRRLSAPSEEPADK